MNREIGNALRKLDGWKHESGEIVKVFGFDNFVAGLEFVKKVAKVAEAMNHHPDVTLTYKSVTLRVTTHSEGAVTEKDIEFARKVDAL